MLRPLHHLHFKLLEQLYVDWCVRLSLFCRKISVLPRFLNESAIVAVVQLLEDF